MRIKSSSTYKVTMTKIKIKKQGGNMNGRVF